MQEQENRFPGLVRCWCFGRSNCNTLENSKLLYDSFVSGDDEYFRNTVEFVDSFIDADNQDRKIPRQNERPNAESNSTTEKDEVKIIDEDEPKVPTTKWTTQPIISPEFLDKGEN